MDNSLRELLEYKSHGNSLNADDVKQLARHDAEFALAWLIHAVGAASSLHEIDCALDAALLHQLPQVEQLLRFCCFSLSAQQQSLLQKEYPSAKHKILAILVLWSLSEPDQQQFVSVFHSALSSSAYQSLLVDVGQQMSLARVHSERKTDDVVQQVRNNSQFPVGSPASHIEWAALERFICATTGQSLAHAEPLLIYRYEVAQEYRWHCDYVSDQLPQNQAELLHFGNRARTAIFCLQDNYSGGETAFKVWQQSFKTRQGQILMFDNLKADGRPNPDSVHCGKAVTAGEKWIATLWFRQKPLWFRAALI